MRKIFIKIYKVLLTIIIMLTTLLMAGAEQKKSADFSKISNGHISIKDILKNTEEKAQSLLENNLTDFNKYMDSMKRNVRGFTEELMSLKSIWLWFNSKLPFTEKSLNKKYIIKIFTEYFFSTNEIRVRINNNIKQFLKSIESLENILAVNLRRVLAGNTGDKSINFNTIELELNKAIKDTMSISEWVSVKEISKLLVLEVSTIAGSFGLSKIIISTGMISAGALNSWWTLGASIIIGIIADKVWAKIERPREKISNMVTIILEKIKSKCVNKLRTIMKTMIKMRMVRYRNLLGVNYD